MIKCFQSKVSKGNLFVTDHPPPIFTQMLEVVVLLLLLELLLELLELVLELEDLGNKTLVKRFQRNPPVFQRKRSAMGVP